MTIAARYGRVSLSAALMLALALLGGCGGGSNPEISVVPQQVIDRAAGREIAEYQTVTAGEYTTGIAVLEPTPASAETSVTILTWIDAGTLPEHTMLGGSPWNLVNVIATDPQGQLVWDYSLSHGGSDAGGPFPYQIGGGKVWVDELSYKPPSAETNELAARSHFAVFTDLSQTSVINDETTDEHEMWTPPIELRVE